MKNNLIIKSNILLQQPLYKTSIELKIFSMVLLKIREQPEKSIISLNIRELMSEFEGSKENYTYIKNVAKKMFGVVDLNPSEKGFDLNVIFIQIHTREKNTITFELNEKIKPYIVNLTTNFTKYYFENITRLKSFFSIRMYEFLKQYESIGKRVISIIELKYFLNIPDERYIKYNHFKTRIIASSKKELKEKTDIYFEFTEIKTGRKITDIEFFIYSNEKKELSTKREQPTLAPKLEALLQKMIALGVKEKSARELVMSHTEERLDNNIRYVEAEIKKGRSKANIGGFIVMAITGDYYNQTDLFKEDEVIKEIKIKREKQARAMIEKKKKEKENEQKKEAKRGAIKAFLDSLSEQEMNSVKHTFYEEHKHSVILRKHLKNSDFDIEKVVVKFNFYEFIFTTYMDE